MIKQVNTKLDMLNFIENELSRGDIPTFLFQSKSGKLFAWDFSKQTHVPVADGTAEQANPYFKEPVAEPVEDVVDETFEEVVQPVEEVVVSEVVQEEPVVETTHKVEEVVAVEEPKIVTEQLKIEEAFGEVKDASKVEPQTPVIHTIETVTKEHHNEIVSQFKLRMEELKTSYEGQLDAKSKEVTDLHTANNSLKEEKEALSVKVEHLSNKLKQLKEAANASNNVSLDKADTVDLVAALAKHGFVVQLTFKN